MKTGHLFLLEDAVPVEKDCMSLRSKRNRASVLSNDWSDQFVSFSGIGLAFSGKAQWMLILLASDMT